MPKQYTKKKKRKIRVSYTGKIAAKSYKVFFSFICYMYTESIKKIMDTE